MYSAYKLNKQGDSIQHFWILLKNKTKDNSFLNFEPVHCSMFSSNCCFLTCIQVSQETGKVVWYYHLFKDFPQFIVTNTVKGFSVVNDVEVVVFLESPYFLYDPTNVGNLISGSTDFLNQLVHLEVFSSYKAEA